MTFFRSKKPTAAPQEIPVPLDHWFRDLAAVQDLRDALASRAYQKAAATLQALANPVTSSVTDNQTRMAHQLAWLAGYHDAFRDLSRLTKLPESMGGLDEEWDYINDPQKPSTYALEDE